MRTLKKNNIKNYSYSMNYKRNQLKKNWRKFISSQNYNVLATIQSPFIKNPTMFEDRFRKFSELDRTHSLFYSVEYNADRKSGYHIHLLINAYKLTKGFLGYALDLKPNQIPYYKPVDSKVKVASYVTKYMKDDQIHYNIF
jgi:hypothetical protein|tara:strand:- start:198 stop:620 length:423 start_codon:yes stop_codon:yes gene_type:complete